MYGYVKIGKKGNVIKISCKKKLSKAAWKDHAIIGTFSFKRADVFLEYVKKLMASKNKIKNEYYMDSVAELCLKAGKKVKILHVKKNFCMGTPDDLEYYLKKNARYKCNYPLL